MNANEFTVENIAGGNLKKFRLVYGELSGSAKDHLSNIGYGGPVFGGPAAETAANLWNEYQGYGENDNA